MLCTYIFRPWHGSQGLLSSKMTRITMTRGERWDWHSCIWMLMCSQVFLDGATLNDNAAFLTPDASLHWTFAETCGYSSPCQQQQTSITHIYAASPPPRHKHTGHEGTEEAPPGWHIARALGRLHGYVWKMRPLSVPVLLVLFPLGRVLFTSIF